MNEMDETDIIFGGENLNEMRFLIKIGHSVPELRVLLL